MAAQAVHVLGLDRDELAAELGKLGLPAYRADQIRQWIFQRRVDRFDEMTNLGKADRARLAELMQIATGKLLDQRTASDGVVKLLLDWPDSASSETVLIPASDGRHTACVSTQAGCPVGCLFCASGMAGLQRNLTAGEIVEQVWQLGRLAVDPQERVSNVVMMGIGEPLVNYDQVVKAIRLINAADGPNIGARKITVSTVGLPRQIRTLAEEDMQVTLAISLHAPNQRLRKSLIPWAERNSIEEILNAARYYFDRTGREITLEYIMLAGVNIEPEHADQLADIAHSLRCNVNLIYYNPVADLGYERPTQQQAKTFRELLARRGVNVHIRSSRGLDVDAACGQLRRRHAKPRQG